MKIVTPAYHAAKKPFKQLPPRKRTIDEMTPEEAKARKAERIKQLRDKIECCRSEIAIAETEINEWENI